MLKKITNILGLEKKKKKKQEVERRVSKAEE